MQDYYEETALHGEYVYNYDDNGNLTQEISSFIQIPVTPLDPDPDDPNPMDEIDIPRELMRGIGDLGPFPGLDPELWDLSGRTEYSYDEAGQLTGAETYGKSSYSYTYNADGLRLQKTVCENGIEKETHYIWNEGRLIAEYDDTQAITVLYDSENSPVGFTVETGEAPNQSTATYIYLKNLQGDITHILDEDGETVVSYTYDPWGNPTIQGNTSIAAINPCSYRGYYYDEETGWYYLQSRYYDPEI